MRGVIAITGLVAVTLTACNRSQAVLDAQVPTSVSASQSTPHSPSGDDSAVTGSITPAQPPEAPAPQMACSRELAAEIVRMDHTLQASNDPCVVYWRSLEVRQHPERAHYLECAGLKAYPDPQPRGHPVSLADCDRSLRERQARMAVPVLGMTEEQKVTYRATWGK